MLVLALVSGIAPAVVVVQTGALITNIAPALGQSLDSVGGRLAQNAIITLGIAIVASQLIGPIRQAVAFGLQRRFHVIGAERIRKTPGRVRSQRPDPTIDRTSR